MITAEVDGNEALLKSQKFPYSFLRFVSSLSGRKQWVDPKAVKILATAGNIRQLNESDFEISWIDKSGDLAKQREFEALPGQHDETPKLPRLDYRPDIKLYHWQEVSLALSWKREAYALLSEMGTGKTATLIASAGMLYVAKKITGVLIIAPKGVHEQWIEGEIPKHIDKRIKANLIAWNGKAIKMPMNRQGLNFLAMNTDSIRTPNGFETAANFLKQHAGKNMLVVDESHNFKTPGRERVKRLFKLKELSTYRRILTGTPMGRNIIDAWTQFNFLDERILGQRYVTAFRARYCVMGGWEGRQIVGQKNTEEFYALIAPHSFRVTKAEVTDIAEKNYVVREYEMSDETARQYSEMKKTFSTQFNDGTIANATHAATALLRLQQIVCGSMEIDGDVKRIGKERIEETLEIIRQVEGPVVIWARFNSNIIDLFEALEKEDGKGCAVKYYGDTLPADRKKAIDSFLAGKARFFLSNPAAGGTGLNLQGKCRNVIYFSNDFNYITRIQSEDRVHRIGATGSVTYFDLVARKSVDRMIIRNLKAKQSISRLTFDEIRMAINDKV